MSFREGDVVVRNRAGFSRAARASIAKNAVGTVCRVVTLGSQAEYDALTTEQKNDPFTIYTVPV